MEQITIKVGKERPIINKIGLYILLIGILFFLLAGGILFVGYYLPLEIKVIYYGEFIHRNIYFAFLISILILILGSFLSDWLKYTPTALTIYEDKISFLKGKEEIELPIGKIHKLMWKKSILSTDLNVTIKTIGLKRYETRIDVMNYSRLKNLLPETISQYKALGI